MSFTKLFFRNFVKKPNEMEIAVNNPQIPFSAKKLLAFKFKVARVFDNIYRLQNGFPKLSQSEVANYINSEIYLTENFSTADLSEAENGKVYCYHVPALIAYYHDKGIHPSFFLKEDIYLDKNDKFTINLRLSMEVYQCVELTTFFKETYKIYVDEEKKYVKYEIRVKLVAS